MAVESVQFTARCDGGCGGDARWSGVPAAFGGGTIYRTPAACRLPRARIRLIREYRKILRLLIRLQPPAYCPNT